MSRIKQTQLKIQKSDLMDGDIFYFPGDGMYVYEVSGDSTYCFGDEMGISIENTRKGQNEVIVIHNTFDNRRELSHG